MENKKLSDRSSWWTNERHMHYLRSMEASFVRTMLIENNNGGYLLRLDRDLPDSAESTLDLKKERRRQHSTSDIALPGATTDNKTRSKPSHPLCSSQDQMVPQIENGTVDNTASGYPKNAN